MIKNADITLYRRVKGNDTDTWEKEYVPDVWHFSAIKVTPTSEGLKTGTNVTNVHTVRITDLNVLVNIGDYIVVGEGPESIESVKDLTGYAFFKVTGANYNRTGHNPHIKVVGV